MADIGNRVTRAVLDLFRGAQGVAPAIAALAAVADVEAPRLSADHVQLLNIAADLEDKAGLVRYPVIHLYCERVNNQLREKFRRFSGKVRMIAECRVSHSHIEGVECQSRLLADAVTEVLDTARGDWGQGMFYTGGYEIAYGPIKAGGRNLIEISRIAFEVHVSTD